MKFFALLVIFSLSIFAVAQEDETTYEPQPYHYKYLVKDREQDLFIEKEETKDENEKVSGFYQVLLANGRLMKVEYVADKEGGFVPRISYEDRNPFTDPKKTSENEVW